MEANQGIFLSQKGIKRGKTKFTESELGFAIGQSIKEEKGKEAYDEYNERYSKIVI